MDTLIIESNTFQGNCIPILEATLLLIIGNNGFLGCGYFNLSTANKMNQALAIVTGVSNYDEMLKAQVKAVSDAALKMGVQIGMSGKEALLLMK